MPVADPTIFSGDFAAGAVLALSLRMSIRGALLPILCALLLNGCQRTDQVPAIAAALQQQLTGPPPASAGRGSWNEVKRFYEARDFAPAWTGRRALPDARTAVALLNEAPGHGLDAEDY